MRARRGHPTALLCVLLIAACATGPAVPTPTPMPHIGGTLRIGINGDAAALREFAYVDPALAAFGYLMRCCLARTLLTYPGRVTSEGGTILQPDLATAPPEISRDGLTWTFRLRRGIRYAPPYQDVEVEAADIIRAVERHARREPFTTERRPDVPYGFVAGAAEYARGQAPNISGLSSPEPDTLVIRLLEPFGGFGTLLADYAWAPMPEEVAGSPEENIGRHWVSTGPYMFETYPADAQAEAVTLVRNPSWERASDTRRGAWVDRIELRPYGDPAGGPALLERGDVDFIDWGVPREAVARYRADPAFAWRLQSTREQALFWIPLNLALPPFDDVAVRRAVNAVVDRAAITERIVQARADYQGPQSPAVVMQHAFPDSLTGGLLLTYAPWASPGDHGDVGRARTEMAASRYDTDDDGQCDAPECRGLIMPALDLAAGELLRRDLARIGIESTVVEVDESNDMALPTSRTPIQLNTYGWAYNLTGSDLAQVLRGGPGMTDETGWTINASLVGATPEQLAGWGYPVTDVPDVDDLMAACEAEVGHLRARCWATLDQYATEVLVPWVPLLSFESAFLSSDRVASYSIDQGYVPVWIALDHVSLKADAGP